ncbi:MAG: tetratricopeptide repeat protein [Synechococcus sp.]
MKAFSEQRYWLKGLTAQRFLVFFLSFALLNPLPLQFFLTGEVTAQTAMASRGEQFFELCRQHLRDGEADYALEACNAAAEEFSLVENEEMEARALKNVGIAFQFLSQFQDSIESTKKALTIARRIGNREIEANSLGTLGISNRLLENDRKAVGYLQQALELFRELEDREGEATALENLGAAYGELGRYREAIDYYQQYLELSAQLKETLN